MPNVTVVCIHEDSCVRIRNKNENCQRSQTLYKPTIPE